MAACLAGLGTARAQPGPDFALGGPDAAAYGQSLGYPVAPPHGTANAQPLMVGSYSHYDRVASTHAIAAASVPSPLRRAPDALELTYRFHGEAHTLAEYLARNPTTGLLIARDDTILSEHYQYARTDQDRLLSQSMAKTVAAMLVGIAVSEGAIRSIDDPAQAYVPGLVGTEMGKTPIRALLHMASGIAFTEDYDAPADNGRLGRDLMGRTGRDPVAAVAQFNTRTAPADTVWHYAGLNTEVLGLVLSHATGMNLSDYLDSRIWQEMGAEAAASWAVDHTGQEVAYCCFSATLRDWARFGLLLAHQGALDGRQIIPRQWVVDATSYQEGSFLAPGADGRWWGYGYQTWLMPGPAHDFALVGIHGQRIFVDPASKLVLVHTAVRVPATRQPGDAELVALWRALVRQQGRS